MTRQTPHGIFRALDGRLSRAHAAALIAFSALLGLAEGPAEIACVLALLTSLATGRLRPGRPGAIEIGILVWLLAGIPGAAVALRAGAAPMSSEDVLRPVLAVAFLLGAHGLSGADDRTLGRMTWAFAIAMIANGAYGYLQLHFGELPLDRFLLKNPKSHQIFVPDHIFGIRGVSGLYYNRLKLAHMGVPALGLIALVVLTRRPQPSLLVRALGVLGAAVLGGAVVLTYARMALAAFAIAAAAIALLLARARVIAAVLATCSALAAGVAMSTFGRERLASLPADLAVRRKLVEMALGLAREHPWLGVGHGVYRSAVANNPGGLDGVLLTSPHNLFLQVLAETGALGLAGFSAALAIGIWRVAREVRRHRASASAEAVMDRFVLFSLIAIVVIGMTHFSIHHAPVALLFWATLGIAARSRASARATAGPAAADPPAA